MVKVCFMVVWENLEGVVEDLVFIHRVYHSIPDVSLMQRTSLVCFKMQRKMQRSLHFISFLIHTSPLGEVGSRSLHLYGDNGSPSHEGPLL